MPVQPKSQLAKIISLSNQSINQPTPNLPSHLHKPTINRLPKPFDPRTSLTNPTHQQTLSRIFYISLRSTPLCPRKQAIKKNEAPVPPPQKHRQHRPRPPRLRTHLSRLATHRAGIYSVGHSYGTVLSTRVIEDRDGGVAGGC